MKKKKHQLTLTCPNCHKTLKKKTRKLTCAGCKQSYPIKKGIPILISHEAERNRMLEESRNQYEKLYEENWQKVDDGSYEVLAAIARGNMTVDIACGEGWVEQLSPETVGCDFSLNALLKAKQKGAKHLICCPAEYLPFPDDHFDLALCAGSFEHFADPQKALLEMARVAPIQIQTIHRELPFPFARQLRRLAAKIKNIKEQPIETPLYFKEIKRLYYKAGLKIIFHGHWTYPTNLRLALPFLPESLNPPSAYFIISRRA